MKTNEELLKEVENLKATILLLFEAVALERQARIAAEEKARGTHSSGPKSSAIRDFKKAYPYLAQHLEGFP